jgi:hypothetical protein
MLIYVHVRSMPVGWTIEVEDVFMAWQRPCDFNSSPSFCNTCGTDCGRNNVLVRCHCLWSKPEEFDKIEREILPTEAEAMLEQDDQRKAHSQL